jgi:hypothetical protein
MFRPELTQRNRVRRGAQRTIQPERDGAVREAGPVKRGGEEEAGYGRGGWFCARAGRRETRREGVGLVAGE